MIKICLLGLTLLAVTYCNLGIVSDASDSTVAAAFSCMAKGGYPTGAISVASSPTQIQIDSAGLANLGKARNAFTKVFLTFFSCRGRDPVKQVDEFVKKISKDLYDIVYVYLGQESLWYQCSPTGYTNQQNCDYMHSLLAQFKKYNINTGIASDEGKWAAQCGTVCNDVGTYPLYWTPQADSNPSFATFKPFGGWKAPAVKVYEWSAKVCGAEVDLLYYP